MTNKILMVEKEISTFHKAQERLSPAGYSILSAPDGRVGLQMAKENNPDLIITDAMAPIMNGFELCKAIIHDEHTKSIPLIVMTENHRMEDSFIYLGVNDFLNKPFSMDDLEIIVRKKLNLSYLMQLQKTKILISGKSAILAACERLFEDESHWDGYYCESKESVLQNALKYKPDIILIDLHMQGIAPDEMVAIIKLIPELKNTIILTYYSNASRHDDDQIAIQAQMIEVKYMRKLAEDAGAREYLGAFNPLNFLNLINAYRKDLAIQN